MKCLCDVNVTKNLVYPPHWDVHSFLLYLVLFNKFCRNIFNIPINNLLQDRFYYFKRTSNFLCPLINGTNGNNGLVPNYSFLYSIKQWNAQKSKIIIFFFSLLSITELKDDSVKVWLFPKVFSDQLYIQCRELRSISRPTDFEKSVLTSCP